ncbi:MAG: Hsp20/alpha crystallin family protein [Alphaproteobacteria bacterium]|nr:Hsp20/alpha crystallin family protein [Alphaproteobacteria bacterium]
MAQQVETVGRSAGQNQPAERTMNRQLFLPATDIYETRDSLVVVAEMPGVAPDAVDITLERRVLTIRGRAGGHQPSGYRQVYGEYVEGDYERVFTLSEDIDRDRIEATHRDGVLHLKLPKAEPAKARKIELKVG